MSPARLDPTSDRCLAIVGLVQVGVAVTTLAATSSARATVLAIALADFGAGTRGGAPRRRRVQRTDRAAGRPSDR